MEFETAPIWNFLLYLHNEILEVLADSAAPINMNQILENIKNLSPDESLGFEAFRKTFRGFKRWFGLNPCFRENLHKTDNLRDKPVICSLVPKHAPHPQVS